MRHWATWTGLWLGAGAWIYAALSVVELRGIDGRDVTRPNQGGYTWVASYVPELTHVVAGLLGLALAVSVVSLWSGRARRAADLLLAAGLLLGGWFLWAAQEPRPVAPWVVGASGVTVLVAAVMPWRAPCGRPAHGIARVLLAGAGLALGWAGGHELVEPGGMQALIAPTYAVGVAVAAAMVGVAVVWPRRPRPDWWSGLLAGLLGLGGVVITVGGVLGLVEGWLVSGFEELETGWYLGGFTVFLGTGLWVAAVAAARGRWPLAGATFAAAVGTSLGILFGIPEIRAGF
jgi:hypothetical protein